MNKLNTIVAAAALLLAGCATNNNAVVSTITNPVLVQDVARTATIAYVQQNPSARADIALVDSAVTSILSTGTLTPAAVQAGLSAAGVKSTNQALYASLISTILDQYTAYAGSATVSGAVNQNAQLSAALSAILAGTAQGLAMTAPAP